MREEKTKELIRLLDETRGLFPELLLTLGSIDRLDPPAAVRERTVRLRGQIEALMERARALEEANDCMPAAEIGRRQNHRG